MYINPHVNLLKSMRGERTNYVDLIGEGVDNALDAGATKVHVEASGEQVKFDDNGCGITRDRIDALFTLGAHAQMPTTQLGRFGVGITSQAINFGDCLYVSSRSKDGRVTADVDWRNVLRSGEWKIDTPRWRPGVVGEATGTEIIISRLQGRPRFKSDKIVDELSLIFFPAIVSGRRIVFNGVEVLALSEPPMSDVVDATISLSGDRSAHVRAGILTGESKLRRVHISYKHRVIMPNNTMGCSGRGGLDRMFARVELFGAWHFHKFKNDLTSEEEREELDDALAGLLAPILEKCDTASFDAKLARIEAGINAGLPESLALRRPEKKRNDPPRQGKKEGRTGEVDEEQSKSDGPARSKRAPRDQLKITFDGRDGEDGIGAVREGGRIIHVDLSKDNPFVAELMAHRDERLIMDCLRALALMIYEAERRKASGQSELNFDFGRRVAAHMRAQSGVKAMRA